MNKHIVNDIFLTVSDEFPKQIVRDLSRFVAELALESAYEDIHVPAELLVAVKKLLLEKETKEDPNVINFLVAEINHELSKEKK